MNDKYINFNYFMIFITNKRKKIFVFYFYIHYQNKINYDDNNQIYITNS